MPPSRLPDTDVIIAGGGPAGLMLAIELGRRGVSVALFDDDRADSFSPQANATQARTMEHFRRLGFADEIRRLGLPPDHPTDIVYYTTYGGYELARFRLPTARRAAELGTRVHTPERTFKVTGSKGETRHLLGCAIFDPDGYFYECNQVLRIDDPE